MLLKALRREAIDWKEIMERHMPQRQCHGFCVGVAGAAWKLKEEFSASEWKDTIDPNCKVCMARRR